MNLYKSFGNKSVQDTVNRLRQADNAIEATRCDTCRKPIGRAERVSYKGSHCSQCFHELYIAEYDITPNDNTARFMIRMGKNSPFVKNATQEQKRYAVDYFKKYGKPQELTPQELVEEALSYSK